MPASTEIPASFNELAKTAGMLLKSLMHSSLKHVSSALCTVSRTGQKKSTFRRHFSCSSGLKFWTEAPSVADVRNLSMTKPVREAGGKWNETWGAVGVGRVGGGGGGGGATSKFSPRICTIYTSRPADLRGRPDPPGQLCRWALRSNIYYVALATNWSSYSSNRLS